MISPAIRLHAGCREQTGNRGNSLIDTGADKSGSQETQYIYIKLCENTPVRFCMKTQDTLAPPTAPSQHISNSLLEEYAALVQWL